MKKIFSVSLAFVALLNCLSGYSQPAPSFTLTPIGGQRIAIAVNKMTNLVFPVAIRVGTKVSREVTVQKVKGLENVIEVKAARRGFTPTNLSVFCLDGHLYSFDLYYSDNPDTVNYQIGGLPGVDSLGGNSLVQLSALPAPLPLLDKDAGELESKGFMHLSDANQRMKLTLRGVYLRDSLLWLVCRLSNGSLVPFKPSYIRLSIADKKRAKRTAMQELQILPVYIPIPSVINGNSRETLAIGYSVFTIPKEKKLLLQVAEENGGRLMTITINHRRLLRARTSE